MNQKFMRSEFFWDNLKLYGLGLFFWIFDFVSKCLNFSIRFLILFISKGLNIFFFMNKFCKKIIGILDIRNLFTSWMIFFLKKEKKNWGFFLFSKKFFKNFDRYLLFSIRKSKKLIKKLTVNFIPLIKCYYKRFSYSKGLSLFKIFSLLAISHAE